MSNGASIHQFPQERSAKVLRKLEKQQKAERKQRRARQKHQRAEQQLREHEQPQSNGDSGQPAQAHAGQPAAGATVMPFPLRPGSTPPPPSSTGAPPDAGASPSAARKHWRIDLKWVFGIPCTIVLALALAVLAMFIATERGRAEQTVATANRTLVAQEFQGDARAYAPQLFAFLESPDFARTVYEDPSTLTAQVNAVPDNAGLPQGVPGAAGHDGSAQPAGDGTAGPAQGLKMMFGLYGLPLSVLNTNVHQILGGIMIVLMMLLVALAVPYTIFSHRVGKLVSLGVSLAFASWIPFLFLKLASSRANDWAAGSGVTEDGERILRQVMQPLMNGMLDPALSVYRVAMFLSLALLMGAGLGRLAIRLREGSGS